ncbi:MAG: hypothetical protein FWD90_02640 [Defluviitaleaceae bacterium]|nr:hypothetical protein [Defluviitaleaceae bacterium]
MARKKKGNKKAFITALKAYDASLVTERPIVVEGVTIGATKGKKSNAVISIIGTIIGAVTGVGFYRMSNPEKGTVLLGDDGLHFFAAKRKRGVVTITNHLFLPFEKMKKAVAGRNFIFANQMAVTGKIEGANGREEGYRLQMPISASEETAEIKRKMEEWNVKLKKARGALVCGIFIISVVGIILFGILMPRWLNLYRAMDYVQFRTEINSPAWTSSGRYQDRRTSFSARIETDRFTIVFGDGTSGTFIGAAIAGNEKIFLLEVNDSHPTLNVGEVAYITAVGRGAIATRAELAEDGGFFHALGVAFGDPRVTGYAAEVIGGPALKNAHYLHMRAVSFDTVAVPAAATGDTYTSANGNYRITFVDAYHTTSGGGRSAEVIMLYYDYEALTAHNANRPLTRNFKIYQGDTELEYWDGGLRAVGDRDFLTQHSFTAGETFRARRAVVPVNTDEPIRVVRYNENFQIIFSHEMDVRRE